MYLAMPGPVNETTKQAQNAGVRSGVIRGEGAGGLGS